MNEFERLMDERLRTEWERISTLAIEEALAQIPWDNLRGVQSFIDRAAQ